MRTFSTRRDAPGRKTPRDPVAQRANEVRLANTGTEMGTPDEELQALNDLFREGGYDVHFKGTVVHL